ncbi:prepilin peptidase [Corynebacterium sp. Q4381]|uniref:prepilin peptidase n=1 Tax=Corynebacterium sp. Marseille-Q4381 TaxID=3121597 RepID=UPI002FE5F087
MGWGLVLCWSLGLLLVDATRHRLPDVLTLPACAVAVAGCVVKPYALWGFAWPACYLFFGRGIGGGDIKLALPLGVALAFSTGPGAVVAAMVLSALFTCLVAVSAGKREVPHGPSMIAAFWLVFVNALFIGAV